MIRPAGAVARWQEAHEGSHRKLAFDEEIWFSPRAVLMRVAESFWIAEAYAARSMRPFEPRWHPSRSAVQPPVARPRTGLATLEQIPESRRMIQVAGVRQLVQQHVVDQRRAKEQQLAVEAHRAARGATTPARALRTHRGTLVAQIVIRGEGGETRQQHAPPLQTKRPGDRPGDARAVCREGTKLEHVGPAPMGRRRLVRIRASPTDTHATPQRGELEHLRRPDTTGLGGMPIELLERRLHPLAMGLDQGGDVASRKAPGNADDESETRHDTQRHPPRPGRGAHRVAQRDGTREVSGQGVTRRTPRPASVRDTALPHGGEPTLERTAGRSVAIWLTS
mgnify:CR=1 FL=1